MRRLPRLAAALAVLGLAGAPIPPSAAVILAPPGGLAALPGAAIPVQSTEEPNDTPSPPNDEIDSSESYAGTPFANPQAVPPGTVTPAGTRWIQRRLSEARQMCDGINRPYVIDCLEYNLRIIARNMPREGDYGEVRRVLEETAADLQRTVERYGDRQGATAVARGGGRRSDALTAIRPANAAAATRAASAAIAEATTVLLRSAENSARRQVHFQQIAQAVDSTKVLLRSA